MAGLTRQELYELSRKNTSCASVGIAWGVQSTECRRLDTRDKTESRGQRLEFR
jgi:hypothetical protein